MGNTVQTQLDEQLRKGRVWTIEEEFSTVAGSSRFYGYNSNGVTISLGITGSSNSEKTKIIIREKDGYSGGTDIKLQNRNRIAGVNQTLIRRSTIALSAGKS